MSASTKPTASSSAFKAKNSRSCPAKDTTNNHSPFIGIPFSVTLYSSVENHAETQRTQRKEERTMTLTSHGNLNLKVFIHHYGDCRTLSVVLVSYEISAFSASLREVIASNERMNCRI